MEFELDKIVYEYEYKIELANITKKYFENEHLYEQSPLKNTKGTCVVDSIAILFFDNNREKSIEWCRKEFSKINKEDASKKSFYSSHFAEIAQMFVDMGYLKEIEGYAKMKVIKAVDKLPGEYLVEVRRHVFCIRNHKIIENMQLSHVCYIKKIYEKIADIREF